MSKAKKITLISVSSFLIAVMCFILIWYFGDNYSGFYNIANAEFEIAGLDEGFIPQGLDYEETTNTYLSCGYMNDGSASRIYVVDGNNLQSSKYFTLQEANENVYVGHAGGIATDGENVWICGEGIVYRFSFNDVLNVENAQEITIIDSFESQNGADFLTINGSYLWVGEFHNDGKYKRPESHKFETTDGQINNALSFCYEINSAKEFGLESTTPIMALSTCSLVQGMVITNDKIILSTSYSLANSNLTSYENILNDAPSSTFEINDTSINVYILETTDIIVKYELPCMSEEIVEADGKIYISFENACTKYRIVTREQLNKVFSVPIENL